MCYSKCKEQPRKSEQSTLCFTIGNIWISHFQHVSILVGSNLFSRTEVNVLCRLLHAITAIFHEVKDHRKSKEEELWKEEVGENDYGRAT